MGMTDKAMKIVISAVDNFSSTMMAIENRAKSFGNYMSGIGTSVAGLGAIGTATTAPIIAGLGLATSKGTAFEKAMKNVQSVTGATAEEYKELTDYAEEMGEKTIYSATDASEGMYYLASAGMNTKEVIASLNPILDLAGATQTGLGDATQIVVSALGQFNLEADQSGRVSDVFASAISGSQANMTKLQYTMKQAGPVASALGYSLEETTAAAMMLYNAGYSGEDAGTTLKQTLLGLLNPTSEAKGIMTQFGIEAYDATGKLKPFNEILDSIKSALNSGMSQQDLSKVFGSTEIAGVLSMLEQGSSQYTNFYDQLSDSAGKATEMMDIQTDSMSGLESQIGSMIEGIELDVFDTIKESLKEMLVSFKDMLPYIKEFVIEITKGFLSVGDYIIPIVQNMMKYFSEMDSGVKSVIGTIVGAGAGIMAVLGPVLLGLGAVTIAIGSISSAVGSIAGLFGGLTISTTLAPLLAIFSVGAVSIAAFKKAWDSNYSNIREKTGGLISNLKSLGSTIFTAFQMVSSAVFSIFNSIASSEGFQDILTALVELSSKVVEVMNKALSSTLKWISNLDLSPYVPLFEKFSEVMNNLLHGIAYAIRVMAKDVQNNFETAKAIIGALENAWNTNFLGIKTIVSTIGSILMAIIEGTLDKINVFLTATNILSETWVLLWAKVEGTLEAVKSMFTDFVEFLGSVWNSLYEFTASIWNDMLTMIETSVNGAISAINHLIKAYNSVASSVGLSQINLLSTVTLSDYKIANDSGSYDSFVSGLTSGSKTNVSNSSSNSNQNNYFYITSTSSPYQTAKEVESIQRRMVNGGF